MGKRVNGRIVILASYKFHFLRVHDILVYDSSNDKYRIDLSFPKSSNI